MHRIFISTLVKKTFAWKDVKWIKIGNYLFYNHNDYNNRFISYYFPDAKEDFRVRVFECHTKNDKEIEFRNLMENYDSSSKTFKNAIIMFADHDYCSAKGVLSNSTLHRGRGGEPVMHKRPVLTNIEGRSKKFKTKNFLDPLFEAISNSIHAIAARRMAVGEAVGKIEVELLREPRQLDLRAENSDQELPITGFAISDTGVGFDEANMKSFCESDSDFKKDLGGKGVGRFAWIKFFDIAKVESVFEEEGKRQRRNFTFSIDGVEEEDVVEVTSQVATKVTLSPLRLEYEAKTRKTLTQVSIEIVEHFIAYLVTGSMPHLKVRDGVASEEIVDFYQKSIGKTISNESFILKGHTFDTAGIKFFLGAKQHTVFLCADKRVVEKIVLSHKDPFFARPFTDENLKEYSFHLYVQSPYLDQKVTHDRDDFSFPKPDTLDIQMEDPITRETLIDKVLEIARKKMASEIQDLKKTNLERVTTFIQQQAPQYRYLLSKHQEAVSVIHEIHPTKIDQALRRLQFEEEAKTREEVTKLLRKREEV